MFGWRVQLEDDFSKDVEGYFIYSGSHGEVNLSFLVRDHEAVQTAETGVICLEGTVFIDYCDSKFGFVLQQGQPFVVRNGQPYFTIDGLRVNYFDCTGAFMPADQMQWLGNLTAKVLDIHTR